MLRSKMLTLSIRALFVVKYSGRVCNSRPEVSYSWLRKCHQRVLPYFSSTRSLTSQPQKETNSDVSDLNQEKNKVTNPIPEELSAITGGDDELEHKLKVLMLETEVLRQDGVPVPDNLTPENWENLMKLGSRSARMKYLGFLFRVSKRKENEQAKKLEKRRLFEERKSSSLLVSKSLPIEEHALTYALGYNSPFIRFQDSTMNRLYNNQLVQAMQFGQKLIIDCGYDQHMTQRENINAAKQLMLLFADNRIQKEPFDIHFTNLSKQGGLEKALHKFIPTMYDRDFPFNVHEDSYLKLFPKQNLVYLTPHCKQEMNNFDHDTIYIVGAIVDKINQEPLSLAKAKREGLVMQKFPLDRYLQWGAGSGKSLTINQCVAILLDMKANNDWNHALRHVPRRKLVDATEVTNNNFKNRNTFNGNYKGSNSSKPYVPPKQTVWRPSSNQSRRISVKDFYEE